MTVAAPASATRARYAVMAFVFAAAFITYLDRVCISVAAPLMQADLGLSAALNGAAAGSPRTEGQRGRSIAGRAGVSARDVVRAKMRARKERRARR